MQWNIRGFKPQRPHLLHAIDIIKPDIICLQETHLKTNHTSTLPGYSHPSARKDRELQSGGGVTIFVHNNIPHEILTLNSPLEVVATKTFFSDTTIVICSLYLPPSLPNTNLEVHLESLYKQLPKPFIICTDSNAHHISWGSEQCDTRGKLLSDWITDSSLVTINSGEPTFLSNLGSLTHIDITICTPDIAPLLMWQAHHDNFNSDHFPILIGSNHNLNTIPSISHWNIKSANWKLFQENISLPNEFLSPTQSCGTITNSILDAAKISIKSGNPAKSRRPSAIYWNSECTLAKKNKNQALNRYRNHLGDINIWIEYKKARAKFRNTIKTQAKKSWALFLSTLNRNVNSSQIWKQIKILRTGPYTKSIILKCNNNTISDTQLVTDCLAQHFSQKSNGISSDQIFMNRKLEIEQNSITFNDDNTTWYNSPINMLELEKSLISSTSKAPGPDNIPYSFLKKLTIPQLKIILNFFNFLYLNNGFPMQWREALVVPILKPGKLASDVSSYRPIALTNCLCKVLEKIINKRLNLYLEQNNFFSNNQSGFRAAHSSLDALTRLEFSAREAILMKNYCVAVFLDIEKAFDSVWHHGLLIKIKNTGLTGHLAKFIQNFISLRKINVKLGSSISSSFPLYSGVPQGSVLSPTLFNIFINDLFSNIPPDIQSSLYADDGAIWITDSSLTNACHKIQCALDSVEKWSHLWGLKIDVTKKPHAIIFSTKRHNNLPNLSLNNTIIPYEKSVRFLGLTFDYHLTWKPHIDDIKHRCQKDLQLLSIISHQNYGADYHTLRKLYMSPILPKIDYGSFIYATAAKTHLLKLDRLQFAASRVMLGALKCTPTFKLDIEANLMPLSIRRPKLLLQYLYRIASIPNHPTRQLLIQYTPSYELISNNLILSAISRAHSHLKSFNISYSKIPTITMISRYTSHQFPIFCSIYTASKCDRSEHQWQDLFNDLIHTTYNDRVQVFTDGSKKDNSVVLGIWSSQLSIVAKLPNYCTIFSAELAAIYLAIKAISPLPGDYVIFTDSLSAIKALQTPSKHNHYLCSWIYNSLSNVKYNKIVIDWVPSHMGIHGNDQADSHAKHSLLLNHTSLTLYPSVSEFCLMLNFKYHSIWKETWSELPTDITGFKPAPDICHYEELPRKHQVAISRIRLNTTKITHKHFFDNSSNMCNICDLPISLRHIFWECPLYNTAQLKLQSTCESLCKSCNMQTVLSPTFPHQIILNFLLETNLISEI